MAYWRLTWIIGHLAVRDICVYLAQLFPATYRTKPWKGLNHIMYGVIEWAVVVHDVTLNTFVSKSLLLATMRNFQSQDPRNTPSVTKVQEAYKDNVSPRTYADGFVDKA